MKGNRLPQARHLEGLTLLCIFKVYVLALSEILPFKNELGQGQAVCAYTCCVLH